MNRSSQDPITKDNRKPPPVASAVPASNRLPRMNTEATKPTNRRGPAITPAPTRGCRRRSPRRTTIPGSKRATTSKGLPMASTKVKPAVQAAAALRSGLFDPARHENHPVIPASFKPLASAPLIETKKEEPSIETEKKQPPVETKKPPLSTRKRKKRPLLLELKKKKLSLKAKRNQLSSIEPTTNQSPTEPLGSRKERADRTWAKRLQELVEFKKANGHTSVPQKYEENRSLGIWVNKQRMEKNFRDAGKPSSLTDERIRLLEETGFIWAKRKGQLSWEEKFAELQQFMVKNKHCNVPTKDKNNRALGRWVSTQRSNYKLYQNGEWPDNARLEEQEFVRRIRRLNGIGFTWNMLVGKKKLTENEIVEDAIESIMTAPLVGGNEDDLDESEENDGNIEPVDGKIEPVEDYANETIDIETDLVIPLSVGENEDNNQDGIAKADGEIKLEEGKSTEGRPQLWSV